MALEKPTYNLLKKDRNFELRAYVPYISSQITVDAHDYNEAANMGFRPLANYIFGANTTSGKIKMTAPVTAQQNSEKIAMTAPVTISGSGTYTVEFVIPRKYTMESLPTPLDDRVRFIQHPARQLAVVRFSGRFRQENFIRHIELLRNWIKAQELEEKGQPIIAGYNPPLVPNFLKHNEILIEVQSIENSPIK